MPDGNAIIKIDGISKPAELLVQKISDAISGFFKPYQIRRVAKAGAEAEVIEAQAQIKITQLQRRALKRFVSEEARKQYNIERIIEKAIPQLSESSSPQDIEDDWISNFFDKCRIISDEEMQSLWGKVLAGEANSPGTFSKRTVNLLGSLDKRDAQLFTTLCGFAWVVGEIAPLIYDAHLPIYAEREINFDTLSHLDDIGLASFEPLAGFVRIKLPQSIIVSYHGVPLTIEFNNPENNKIEIGKVTLTQAGTQLVSVCGAKPVDGFYDYVVEKWTKEGLRLSSPYPRVYK